jgi:hypothetical protein
MSTQKWLLGFLIKADIWGKSEAAVKKSFQARNGTSPGGLHQENIMA